MQSTFLLLLLHLYVWNWIFAMSRIWSTKSPLSGQYGRKSKSKIISASISMATSNLAADVEVRREDQLMINEFGKLNNRLLEIRAELQQMKLDVEKVCLLSLIIADDASHKWIHIILIVWWCDDRTYYGIWEWKDYGVNGGNLHRSGWGLCWGL